jgi:hypothetical protein
MGKLLIFVVGYVLGGMVLAFLVGFIGSAMEMPTPMIVLAGLVVLGLWLCTGYLEIILRLYIRYLSGCLEQQDRLIRALADGLDKQFEEVQASLERLERRNDLKLEP